MDDGVPREDLAYSASKGAVVGMTRALVRIPGKPATESGGNRPGRSEATLEVDNHDRGGRFESIRMTLFG